VAGRIKFAPGVLGEEVLAMTKLHAYRRAPIVALACVVLLSACHGGATTASKVPSTEPGTTVAATNAQKAAPVKTTLLQGLTSIGNTPLVGAQLRVVDAINNTPIGIVAAGGGNIVAAGGGNIVAAGGGNIVAAGGGNIVATGGGNLSAAGGGHYRLQNLAGKSIVTDAKGSFKIAVAGLKPGRVARIIATLKGKTVTCLVSGDGQAIDPKATKKYALFATSDTSDLEAVDGSTSFEVDTTDQVLLDPTHTMASNALAPALELLGRLSPEARASDCDKLLLEGLKIEDDLQKNFDNNPLLADKMAEQTDPDTGALSNDFVKATLTASGDLEAVQAETITIAKDVSIVETDSTKLATKSDAELVNADSDLAAVGMSLNAQGQLEDNGKTVATIGAAPTPPNDPVADGAASDATLTSSGNVTVSEASPTPSDSASPTPGDNASPTPIDSASSKPTT
jgi:hypothetical protein